MARTVPGSSKRLKVLSEVSKGSLLLVRVCGFATGGGGTVWSEWPAHPPPCPASQREWHQGIWFLQLLSNARVKAGRSVAAH